MPLDRLVLILAVVVIAAGLTVWIGAMLVSALAWGPVGWLILLPLVPAAYVVWRVVADRIGNAEDDRYDRIEK